MSKIVNEFKTDEDIARFLHACKAHRLFIDYCIEFKDCSSVRNWINKWERGWFDFGGHFGQALFRGDLYEAITRADIENTKNLKRMLFGD